MRHSVSARLLLTFVCTVCALALPTSAFASDSSPVHVDPSSPVAKEYALPLATARGAPPESGQTGKLFGAGIKHPAAGTTPTPSETTPAATDTTPAVSETPSSVPQTEPQAPTTVTTATETTATETSPAKRPARRHPPHVTTVTLPTLTAPAKVRQLSARATPAAYRVLRPGSGSGLLWMLLAAVVVLAIGSAGGVALSRRR